MSSDTPNLTEAAGQAVPVPDMRRRKKAASAPEEREPDLFVHLKPDCPVTALGVQGDKVWLLDRFNQLQCFKPDEIRKGVISLIFGQNYALEEWPQMRLVEGTGGRSKEPARFEPNGKVDQDGVQNSIIGACAAKGIFKPQGKVFGRGAHRGRDDDAQLILHMGNKVWISGARDFRGAPSITLSMHKAGAIDGKYFPADDALQPPAAEASAPEDAEALQALFSRWYWVEPKASAILLLGMVAQMFLPGALGWRSHVWLAGPTAAGKSSLQKIIRAIHGDWVLTAEDASEAAIRQLLGNDTLPVMIDEAEGADNPERQRAMMNLAKKSSSGGKVLRGGADHKGQEFTAQSCFLFSSVLHTPMLGEDRNRFAILDMKQVPVDAPPIDIGPMLPGWRAIGRKMHRRMLEQWPRFEETLATYKREIHSHGYMGRWQDTYGTLLACADMLLYNVAPAQESEANGEDHGREKRFVQSILPMMVRSQTEARPDDERCIAYLMSLTLPGANGAAPETIGQWLQRAMEPRGAEQDNEAIQDPINEVARSRLKTVGLRLVTLTSDSAGNPKLAGEPLVRGWDTGYLAVAYATCKPLNDLFRNSNEWAGGNWLQSLGKIDGVRRGLKIRFAGANSDYALAIPLKALKGDE